MSASGLLSSSSSSPSTVRTQAERLNQDTLDACAAANDADLRIWKCWKDYQNLRNSLNQNQTSSDGENENENENEINIEALLDRDAHTALLNWDAAFRPGAGWMLRICKSWEVTEDQFVDEFGILTRQNKPLLRIVAGFAEQVKWDEAIKLLRSAKKSRLAGTRNTRGVKARTATYISNDIKYVLRELGFQLDQRGKIKHSGRLKGAERPAEMGQTSSEGGPSEGGFLSDNNDEHSDPGEDGFETEQDAELGKGFGSFAITRRRRDTPVFPPRRRKRASVTPLEPQTPKRPRPFADSIHQGQRTPEQGRGKLHRTTSKQEVLFSDPHPDHSLLSPDLTGTTDSIILGPDLPDLRLDDDFPIGDESDDAHSLYNGVDGSELSLGDNTQEMSTAESLASHPAAHDCAPTPPDEDTDETTPQESRTVVDKPGTSIQNGIIINDTGTTSDESFADLSRLLKRLEPGEYLNDQIIFHALSYFCSHGDMRILDSLVRVRHATFESVAGEARYCIQPWHLPEHWVLFCIDRLQAIVYEFDSLRRGGISNAQLLKAWLGETSKFQNSEKAWTYVHKKHALQPNGFDCGIYVIVNAVYFSCGLDAPSTVDSNSWRIFLQTFFEDISQAPSAATARFEPRGGFASDLIKSAQNQIEEAARLIMKANMQKTANKVRRVASDAILRQLQLHWEAENTSQSVLQMQAQSALQNFGMVESTFQQMGYLCSSPQGVANVRRDLEFKVQDLEEKRRMNKDYYYYLTSMIRDIVQRIRPDEELEREAQADKQAMMDLITAIRSLPLSYVL